MYSSTKIAFVFALCAIVVSGYSIPDDYYEQLQALKESSKFSGVEFSEAAKIQLREAAKKAISYVCLLDDVDQQIVDTVCARALLTGVGERTTYATPKTCFDCEVADPVCYNGCPQ